MKTYTKGQVVYCPCCGKLPDGEEYPVEDYFAPPIEPHNYEEIECGNCYALIGCEVSSCGKYFLFYVAYGE